MNYTIRNTEKALVALYRKSRESGVDADRAKLKIKIMNYGFRLVGAFTNTDHESVVQQLYFSRDNLFEAGILPVSYKLCISERTLKRYRDNYCSVADLVFRFFSEFGL